MGLRLFRRSTSSSGGSGTPGGSSGQIQYNNAGAFGGISSTGSGNVVRATGATLVDPVVGTQAPGDNSTKAASTAYVDTALAGVVQVLHGQVATFADLPAAADHNGENYLVRQSQGVFFVNRKKAGIYTSDGAAWTLDGDATEAYFQDTLAWTNITSKPSEFAPEDHASNHTDGTDDIQDATASQKGLATAAQITKLDAIEAAADVTDAGNVGAAIHGASGKTTPVDADTVPLIDSAASNALKKVTWANIKATLKAYFDPLYVAIGGALGTPLSGTLSNCTGLPPAGLTSPAKTKVLGFGRGVSTGLTTGVIPRYIQVPFGATISAWSIAVDTGTATVKFWKVAAGPALPTVANVINTSGVAISTGTFVRSTTVTDFTTTTNTAGDIWACAITAVAGGATQIDVQVELTLS